MRNRHSRLAILTGGALWLCVIAYGSFRWMQYDHTPGLAVASPLLWPADSNLELNRERGTLLVFAHPYCACSRAGLAKVALALPEASGRPDCVVLFSPTATDDGTVEECRNARIAAQFATLPLQVDADQAEARRFGATTSGFVLFYDSTGRLRFAGGVTAARGAEQDCEYEHALIEAIENPRFPLVVTPVFGCPLARDTSK